MSLLETSDRGPRHSGPMTGGTLTLLAGIAFVFLVALTFASNADDAHADRAAFQPKGEVARATSTATCTLSRDYRITVSANATMIPANNYIAGTGCSNCVVRVSVPFEYSWYDLGTRTYLNLSSEGNLQVFSEYIQSNNMCRVPPSPFIGAILPYFDDLDASIDDTMGYYTATVGSAPNRIFAIRFHGGKLGADSITDYEVLLYEGQPRFDIIYGTVDERGVSATIGVQALTGGDGRWTTYSCNSKSVSPGTRLRFDRRICESGVSP